MDDQPLSDSGKQEEQRVMAIRAVRSFVLALFIVLMAIVLLIVLVLTKQDPKVKEEKELIPSVRVEPIAVVSHEVVIETQGVVKSLHEVVLSAEVGGRVMEKWDGFLDGAEVKKDQWLIKIDPVNYLAAKARAASTLEDARFALEQEQAMKEQADLDWKKLGRGEASDLVLRKPQLAAAMARLASAEADLERAAKDVERATICAPFDARVRMASVDVGTVLAPGTPVAELYSPDALEVRLPFTLLDYGFLKEGDPIELVLSATVGGEEKTWPAVLDRIDGEVQRSTLSAYGMATIRANAAGELPPVGLFVEAVVPGKKLDGVVVLPRAAVRGSNEVWVVNKAKLAKRTITILRSTSDRLVARGDFKDGDQLVLTRLSVPLVGMKVEAIREELKNP